MDGSGCKFSSLVVSDMRSLIRFLITYNALINAIGRSAECGNSAACFITLSTKSLPGIFTLDQDVSLDGN